MSTPHKAILPPSASHRPALIVAIVMMVLFLLVGVALFARAMAQPFSHDEHQFIAAGWWLAKAGLLPYLDFPYHHMPYQIPLNALAAMLSPYVLLSGRLVSWVAAWAASGVLLVAVWNEFRVRSKALAAVAAGLAVIVFISQPIVAYTSGQAWNHDWANLLALGAVLLQLRMIDGRGRPWLGVAVGLLAGLATGVRLSYAVLCPLLMASAAAIPTSRRARWRNASLVLAGIVVAGLPAAILLALDPKAFGYGNILYPQLNSLYRDVLRYWSDNGLLAKFGFFGETVLSEPGNVVLLVGTLVLVVFGLTAHLRDRASIHALLLAFVATVLLFVAGFAPTPAWYQYFFACVPFAILTSAVVIARVAPAWAQRAALLCGAAAAGISIAYGTWDVQMVRRLQSPANWIPVQVHQFGQWLAQEIPAGPVLTLAPVLAMEGGLSTYEAFATGPFTWRVAHIIPEANRRLVGWIGRDDLAAYLAARPPTAVLTGLETENDGFEPGQRGNLEDPLEAYALQAGYRRIPLRVTFTETELDLWTAPTLP